LARIVQRLIKFGTSVNDDTPLSTFNNTHITSKFTRDLLRHTCHIYGGKDKFGFDPSDIGNHSIRSGAAMALFLMNYHSDRIMILGRWKSTAFLIYIRPQVMEWTSNMSTDMIRFNSFREATSTSNKHTSLQLNPFQNGHRINNLVPQLHLQH
jgi:hypothetical protein